MVFFLIAVKAAGYTVGLCRFAPPAQRRFVVKGQFGGRKFVFTVETQPLGNFLFPPACGFEFTGFSLFFTYVLFRSFKI